VALQQLSVSSAVVTDAKSFYSCAKAASSGIEVLHIPASYTEQEKKMLEMRWQNCASLPQTQSVDFVEARQLYVIYSKKCTSDTKETVCNGYQRFFINVAAGQFVLHRNDLTKCCTGLSEQKKC